MSCPDWHVLSDRRAADVDDDPAWAAALEHFDGCRRCRAEALRVEPTLLFRRLPAPRVDAAGIDAMKRAVAGMRRIEPIERRRSRTPMIWLQAAVLAGLLLGAAGIHGPRPEPAGAVAPTAVAEAPAAVGTAFEPVDLHAETARALRQMPLVESADPFFEPIIQVDEEISLVVVSLPGAAGPRNLGV